MEKVINAIIVTPSKKSEKPYCRTITCSNSDNCSLYKSGQCTLSSFFSERCPYGSARREEGPTQRARSYSSWIKEKEEFYKAVRNKLSSPSKKLAVIGEYIYLPYSHMSMNKDIPFLAHSHFMSSGTPFIHQRDWTLKTALSLVTFRPQAMMGGEIKNYQGEEVPKFLKHLNEHFPGLYISVIMTHPEYRLTEKQRSNVGREAVLSTLKPNTGKFVDIHKGEWNWDGEYLTSVNSRASFMLVNSFSEIKIKPSPTETVKITSDEQVTSKTVFKN